MVLVLDLKLPLVSNNPRAVWRKKTQIPCSFMCQAMVVVNKKRKKQVWMNATVLFLARCIASTLHTGPTFKGRASKHRRVLARNRRIGSKPILGVSRSRAPTKASRKEQLPASVHPCIAPAGECLIPNQPALCVSRLTSPIYYSTPHCQP